VNAKLTRVTSLAVLFNKLTCVWLICADRASNWDKCSRLAIVACRAQFNCITSGSRQALIRDSTDVALIEVVVHAPCLRNRCVLLKNTIVTSRARASWLGQLCGRTVVAYFTRDRNV
jgi:hypothetical protein